MEKRVILAFLLCMVIGLGIVVQARITDGQKLFVSASSVAEYELAINAELISIGNIEQMIAEAEDRLSLYAEVYDEESEKNADDMEASLQKEWQDLRVFTGIETVRGGGVIVTVDDGTRELYEGEDLNNLLVHDADILMIINELKRTGAEAISVNGQRIVNSTSISCSGYTVRIDGMTYARPFVIMAIGDAKRMTANLIGDEGYGTSLKNWGVQFKIETVDEMIIEGHPGLKTYKYMTVKEDEEA